jgi:Cu+-exporting ATPase
MTRLEFEVSGLHCGACVARVRKAFAPMAAQVEVTLQPPRLTLLDASEHDFARLQAAARQAGPYELHRLAQPQ